MKKLMLTAGVALVGAVVSAADFHWTGAAGDHLWSTAGNWTDKDGKAVAEGPVDWKQYSYKFENYPDGMVVTQDINVVTGVLSVQAGNSETVKTLTWVSASGKSMKFQGTSDSDAGTSIYIGKGARLVLNCDMSADSWTSQLKKYQNGTLAFKLTKANQNTRQLIVSTDLANPDNTVEFLAGGVSPNIGLGVEGREATLKNNEQDYTITALYNAQQKKNASDLGRVETMGHRLTVGTSANSTSTNLMHLPILARGGTFAIQAERMLEAQSLPIGGEFDLGRADWVLKGKPLHIIRWTFDDPSDPTKDLLGAGSRMLAPKGMPSVVSDSVRGNVLKFEGGKYFKGPDANAGLNELAFQPTNMPYTVAFWLKPDAKCDKLAKLFFWGLGSSGKSNQSVALRLNVGNDPAKPLMFTTWGDNKTISSSVKLFDGNWHHIVVTHNGDQKIRVYLDGGCVLDYAKSGLFPPNRNLYIGSVYGGWTTDGGNPYTGLMDDFSISSYFATADDVASLYKDGLKATYGVTDVTTRKSGTLSLDDRNYAVGKLAGVGLMGGVESRGEGRTLTVGAEETTGRGVFGAQLRGGNMTLEKLGTNYTQVLCGPAASVTNVVIREGKLEVRRPLARAGLVVHYGFDSVDELLNDDGPGGLVLAPANEAKLPSFVSDGVKGGALHFAGAGVNSGVNFRPSNFPSGNESYTISVWIRPAASACTDATPFVCWGNAANQELVYLRFNSASEIRYSNYSEDLSVTGLGTIADGKWHHVVATFDSAAKVKRLYFDGVLKGEKTSVQVLKVANNRPLRLGQKWDASLNYTGDLDEFTVCDYAWTAQEAAAEYAGKAPAAVTADSLLPKPLAHWTFDDEENLGADSSGNGYDLTMVNTVEAQAGGLICGKAAKITADSGYFKLTTIPSTFPTGSKELTIIYRVLADTTQDESAYSTVLTWGNAGKWDWGELIKLGTNKGRGGPRLTVVGTVTGDEVLGLDYYRTTLGAERQRWTTVAVSYRPSENGQNYLANLYVDGEFLRTAKKGPNESGTPLMNLKAQDFAIGAMATGTAHFRGLIDDIQIYDKGLSAGQIRCLSEKLSNGGALPSVLPSAATVSVAEEASLEIAADQSLASLAGAGKVTVAPLAKLAVGSTAGFTGTLSGKGTLAISAITEAAAARPIVFDGCLALNETGIVNWAKSVQPAGWVTVATAQGGIVGFENLANWTTSAAGRKIEFKLSADGKSLLALAQGGLSIFVR